MDTRTLSQTQAELTESVLRLPYKVQSPAIAVHIPFFCRSDEDQFFEHLRSKFIKEYEIETAKIIKSDKL